MTLEEWEQKASLKIEELRMLLANEDIAEDEYHELVQDVLDIRKIEKQIQTENQKIIAQKVINSLMIIAKAI